jgi:hypothetical protein
MSNTTLSPCLPFSEWSAVEWVARAVAVLLQMGRDSQHEKELAECAERAEQYQDELRKTQEKLQNSEAEKEKAEKRERILTFVLLLILLGAVFLWCEYELVPRSLPA